MSRIDVHAHYLPEVYRGALVAAGHTKPDGMPDIPAWDAGEHVVMMDRLGIRTGLLSISTPGVHFGDDADARALAREVNRLGREAARQHPGRFGLLASVPLPDVSVQALADHLLRREVPDGPLSDTLEPNSRRLFPTLVV